MAQVRNISQFAPHEIASEGFRDTVVELKALRTELDRLNRRESRDANMKEKEAQAFQWLTEQVSDASDHDLQYPELHFQARKRRRRSAKKKPQAIGWASDEFDDGVDDDDEGALTDDLVSDAKGFLLYQLLDNISEQGAGRNTGSSRQRKVRKESSNRSMKDTDRPSVVKEEAGVAMRSQQQPAQQLQQSQHSTAASLHHSPLSGHIPQKAHPQMLPTLPTMPMPAMPFALQGALPQGFKPHPSMHGMGMGAVPLVGQMGAGIPIMFPEGSIPPGSIPMVHFKAPPQQQR